MMASVAWEVRLGVNAGPAVRRSSAVVVQAGSGVSDAEIECAEAMVGAVLARHRRAVGPARLRVSTSTSGAGLIQVNLPVHGAPARIQVPAGTVIGAISAAAVRLDRQIRRLTTTWQPWPWPDPERAPLGVAGVAPVVRRKAYRLRTATPCQARASMDAWDYDAFLFADAQTGEDAIVYRSGPTGLSLARQRTMHPPSLPPSVTLTVNPRRTPTLGTDQAIRWLTEGWLPFVFYTDQDSARGTMLYRRYDGNLGLVTSA
jgi:hypothetical protein